MVLKIPLNLCEVKHTIFQTKNSSESELLTLSASQKTHSSCKHDEVFASVTEYNLGQICTCRCIESNYNWFIVKSLMPVTEPVRRKDIEL
jgi:hypothetical protein